MWLVACRLPSISNTVPAYRQLALETISPTSVFITEEQMSEVFVIIQ